MPILLAVLLFIVALCLLVAGPILTIWAVNLLFSTAIPVTFWTWLSTAWLCVQFGGQRVYNATKSWKEK